MSAQISIDFAATRPDRRPFERQVVALRDDLYGAAMRLTRDPEQAEDLVQDTMVRALRFWQTFKPGTKIKAWLFTIQRNAYINGYHRAGRAKAFDAAVKSDVRSLGESVTVGGSTYETDSDQAVSARDTTAKVAWAIAMLPPDYRRAVTLCDIDGLTYKEIAAEMDCPMGTVMSRIHRGRKQLAKALHGHAVDLGLIDRPSTRKDRAA